MPRDHNNVPMTVRQVLARSLVDGAVGPIFGLVGDANLHLVDSYVREFGGEYVAAANEAGGVLMALGYGAASGKVGVATITHGPALTNTGTALVEGVKASIPMLLLCGDTAVEDRDNFQNIPQREFIQATGAGFEQLRSAETAQTDLLTAIRRARVERRPVALNIPTDLQGEDGHYATLPWQLDPRALVVPDGEALEAAVGIVAFAKRPIVLAGRGAADRASREALLRLARRIGAPVSTTLKARDLFRGEGDNLGVFGTLSTPAATEAILRSDCIIAFGAGLNKYTTSNGTFISGKRLIYISARAEHIAMRHEPTVSVRGDAVSVCERLIHWLDEADVPGSGFTTELSDSDRSLAPLEELTQGPDTGLIDIFYALDRLNRAIPAVRTLVTDAGRFLKAAWQAMDAPSPQDFLVTHNFGSIGLGMGYAIGAGIAVQGRPVVMVTGDGGFMLGGLTEFNTAVRHHVDLIVIVCNDHAYGAEHVQFVRKSMDPSLSEFAWPDLAPVATSLGGTGICVRSVSDLDMAVEAVRRRTKPLLIELKLNPYRIPRG